MSRVIENPRELILKKAEVLLFNEGYSSVNIRRVAKDCGIAVGTIYNYFPGKKELVIEMMVNFWINFFLKINTEINSDKDFYLKLKYIMDELSCILKRFKDVWLKNELYSTPDYIASGMQEHNTHIGKLISMIEEMLKSELEARNREIDNGFTTHSMAKFIVINFISMIQMPFMDYDFFEKILKKLI
ncbi:MAG: TetR/AcrR family transcriptional regulator [Spirochaetales bacterium]|nr:TetR/AcrR family transcriptional regulator [Spirochaetales bacterium]